MTKFWIGIAGAFIMVLGAAADSPVAFIGLTLVLAVVIRVIDEQLKETDA